MKLWVMLNQFWNFKISCVKYSTLAKTNHSVKKYLFVATKLVTCILYDMILKNESCLNSYILHSFKLNRN